MARLCTLMVACILLLVCSSIPSSTDARKLMIPNFDESLFLSSLPKGTPVPPSGPSKRGHAMVVNEKLFAVHIAKIDRILRSVPSPGAGH